VSRIITNRGISRRAVLRGFGVSLGLPMLDAMSPGLAFGSGGSKSAKPTGPTRLCWVYVPNGKDMPNWTPKGDGTKFELTKLLEPLAPFRDRMLVLSGLTVDKARANGDGPGDHARAMAAFLTGCQARKTGGANIRAGVSADQLAAQKLGHLTAFRSLELGLEGGPKSGVCDSGYACAYQHNFSWRSETTPMPMETDAKAVFERLFGSSSKNEAANAKARRDARRKSVLDYVLDDAKSLRGDLGGADVNKLDEYLASVRDVEQRINRPQRESSFKPTMPVHKAEPKEFAPQAKLMADVLVLAFQADLSRICTFAFGNDGSTRSYPHIGVPDGHHDISHHGRDKVKVEKIHKINFHHVQQFAYFIGRLKAAQDGDANLLDRSLVLYGSGLGDGDRHNHDDLPILLLGGGNGTVKPGRHIRYPKETPLTNLHLAMLDRFGAKATRLGDSTGLLEGLS
jgi:hypothetical protein